jgi:hypothetical protein
MTTTIVVLILSLIAVIFGVIKKHHHAWVAFAAVVLGATLMRSVLAGPVQGLVNAIVTFFSQLLQAIGITIS